MNKKKKKKKKKKNFYNLFSLKYIYKIIKYKK